MAEAQLTPMMAQYRRIKSELPRDALLLFRLGDCYELFFEDAKNAVPPEVVGGARTIPIRRGKNIPSLRTRTNGAA